MLTGAYCKVVAPPEWAKAEFPSQFLLKRLGYTDATARRDATRYSIVSLPAAPFTFNWGFVVCLR